jgi:hypothetical protein
MVLEVKACREWTPSAWLAELGLEISNDNAESGVVIVKRRGTTDVNRWYALTSAGQWLDLIHKAGW